LKELGRQSIHAGFGLAVIAVGLLFGKTALLLLLMALFALCLAVITLKIKGFGIPIVDEILNFFERPKVYAGKGALYHIAGVLSAIALTNNLQFGFALVAILAVGDGISTVVGVNWGKRKLHWNKHKSFEGTAAFFIFGAAAAYPFIGLAAVGYAFALAMVESLPSDIDDNLLVPVAGLVLRAIVIAVVGA
jgi:dolichol kinase